MKQKLKRICILNPQAYVMQPPPLGRTDTGGQTLYILQLAKALGKKGFHVDIVTRQFNGNPAEEKIFDNVTIVRIPAGNDKFLPKEKLYELMPEMMENLMHYLEITKKTYDLVHSHYWDGGYAGLLLSKMLDIPHVHTPHSLGKMKKLEMAVEDVPVKKLKPIYRYHVRIAIEQKILNKANAVTVLCETTRIQILQHYLVDFEKLHVIYPGIDTEYFNPKPTKRDKEHTLSENAIVMICRLVPAKGIDRAIDAVAHLKNKIPFHLYIAGGTFDDKGSEEEQNTKAALTELIKKHKLQNHVSFLGYLDHDNILPSIYRNAELFILGGRYEPFGLTTLESMACGTVPIISQSAGSREVIIDGLNGYVTNTSDRKQLSELIEKLLKDAKLRKKVADNAAFTIKEHYTWDKIVDKFIALYHTLL